jgi:hypothetical protein
VLVTARRSQRISPVPNAADARRFIPEMAESYGVPVPPLSVNLLPTLDPYVMGYRDRRRFLAPEHYDQVFDQAGNAFATIWVNGQVVGVWRELEAAIELLLLWDVGGEALALLEAEAKRLGRFLTGGDVEIVIRCIR